MRMRSLASFIGLNFTDERDLRKNTDSICVGLNLRARNSIKRRGRAKFNAIAKFRYFKFCFLSGYLGAREGFMSRRSV